ncbi:hypothetical protein D3C81_1128430 [compost metagenome]
MYQHPHIDVVNEICCEYFSKVLNGSITSKGLDRPTHLLDPNCRPRLSISLGNFGLSDVDPIGLICPHLDSEGLQFHKIVVGYLPRRDSADS